MPWPTKTIFDGEPAGREETKDFCDMVEELKKYPGQGLPEQYVFVLCADRVFILNTMNHRYLMTTKFTLFEFWPQKVREMES
jgi:hypothetical protein